MKIFSFSPFGYEGALVTVEVDLRRGIPAIDVVGLADGAVRESRERMRAAIRNSGFDFPPERVLISLSPADVKKEGAGFDLAIALAVLLAMTREGGAAGNAAGGAVYTGGAAEPSRFAADANGAVLVMGELELSGKTRPVRGVHAAVSSAVEQRITRCIVPGANAREAESCGLAVCGAYTLAEAFEACFDASRFSAPGAQGACEEGVAFPDAGSDRELSVVKNQGTLVRALQIAAAGRHHLLAFGPPGCGKTLALSRFPALLPYLTGREARPVSRIHSLAGSAQCAEGLIRTAPFRAPHQSSSLEGMTGGGPHCSPGEISLAHNGALFLDEVLEFKPHVLQSLRVPLETGSVTVSRAGRNAVYPARFTLLAAANPCPCGAFGSRGKLCLCSPRAIEQYWKKFSGPLLDRIDIRVPVFQAQDGGAEQKYSASGASTRDLRRGIARAVAIQRERQDGYNSALSPEETRCICALEEDAEAFLAEAALLYGFSSRGTSACRKIARTIADMAGSAAITRAHIEEAVFFRKSEGGLACDTAWPR